MSRLDPLTRYRRSATEAELESVIRDAVENLGGWCWHVRDSRKQDVEDMLDMVIVMPPRDDRPGIVGLIETKSHRRDVTLGQARVLGVLADCTRIVSGVMRVSPRPGEMSVEDVLFELTGEETP